MGFIRTDEKTDLQIEAIKKMVGTKNDSEVVRQAIHSEYFKLTVDRGHLLSPKQKKTLDKIIN